jgi:hypothetical protein
VLLVRGIAAPPGWLLAPHSRPVPTVMSSQDHRAMRVPAVESFPPILRCRTAAPDGRTGRIVDARLRSAGNGAGDGYGAGLRETCAPGGSPSRWAASPELTASETMPDPSAKATSSPGATAPNVSR